MKKNDKNIHILNDRFTTVYKRVTLTTSTPLTKAYFETIDAPRKSFTVIAMAAHNFIYEKP